jgi:hypothetical protein
MLRLPVMDLQATQGIESAIVLASVNSSPEKYDSSLELAFRASIPALLAVPKDKLQSVNVDVPWASGDGTPAIVARPDPR